MRRCDHGQQGVGHVHDVSGRAVVDGQLVPTEAVLHVRFEGVGPAIDARRGTRLRRVTDERHPAGRAAPHNHAPFHGREFLGFVDNNVAIGPESVGLGAFGGGANVADFLALGEGFGINHVVCHQDFGIEPVVEVLGRGSSENVQSVLGFFNLFLPALFGGFAFLFGIVGA